jgi:dihydroxy-acid dehydratase
MAEPSPPGQLPGKDVTIQDVFEAVGANAAGKMTDAELLALENVACPGAGACGGQYTANTMSTALEMIGLSPMGFNSVPAMDGEKDQIAFACGAVVLELLKRGLVRKTFSPGPRLKTPSPPWPRPEGSTNAVLHLLAIAREAGVPLEIDDFHSVSQRTPLLADLKPSGRFVAADMHRAGGIRLLADRLLRGGHLDGSALTVSGKSLEQESASAVENRGSRSSLRSNTR